MTNVRSGLHPSSSSNHLILVFFLKFRLYPHLTPTNLCTHVQHKEVQHGQHKLGQHIQHKLGQHMSDRNT